MDCLRGSCLSFLVISKKLKRQKEYEKLTKDDIIEKVLKKYNIKPVDWK